MARSVNRVSLSDKGLKAVFIGAFLGPIVLYYVFFLFYPLISSFFWTFMNYNPLRENNAFIGLGNYVRLLEDPVFRTSIRNTFLLVLYIVPSSLVVSLVTALALDSMTERTRTVFCTAYFLPVVTSMIAGAAIWMWLYHPSFGLLNYFLRVLGLRPLQWLNNMQTVLPSIAAFSVWKGFGIQTVIFLAGLKGIPETYYEACRLDGATNWKTFWYVTFPMLRPTFVFVLATSVISTFQLFTEVYVMTGGGPVHSSRVLGLYIYERGIRYLEMGYASTMAYILFAIIFILTLIQLKRLSTSWEY